MNQPLDDTTELICHISDAYNVKDHTEYSIDVRRGPSTNYNWKVTKRYSDFCTLNDSLGELGIALPLPPKRMFGNMTHEFIAERQKLLQIFIDTLMGNIIMKHSLQVKRFFDNKLYSYNISETHLNEVSMFMRSNIEWQIVQPLNQIGWRLQKSYILVKQKLDSKQIKMILSYVKKGKYFNVDNKQVTLVLKYFANIQHPHIFPIEYAVASLHGIIHIRKFGDKGTLRDMITQAKPLDTYLKKYGNNRKHLPCTIEVIRSFSLQILCTLSCLHKSGMFYGNLHAGNVIVDRCTCYLLDLENVMAGVPMYYRDFIIQHRKINTIESIDVYCYGHLLYEMAYGIQLNTASCDFFPSEADSSIREILNLILGLDACRHQMPTIEDILSKTLFNGLAQPEMKSLKVSTKITEIMNKYQEHTLYKLKHDQKNLYKMKRLKEAQAFNSSDEHKIITRKHNKAKRKSEQIAEKKAEKQEQQEDSNQDMSEDNVSEDSKESAKTPDEPPIRSALMDSIASFKKKSLRSN